MIINQIKTFVLLLVLTVLLLFVGSFFGTTGLTIAFILVLIMNVGSYWFSDKLIIMIYKAKIVTKKQSSELHEIVEDLAKKANIPKPKIFLIPSNTANAFCVGRSPKHSMVAVTKGIVKLLNKSELRGVLAHEIAHIKNRDTLISVIAATIAGVISYLAMMARFSAIFGGGRDRDSGNMLGMLAFAIVAPLAALIIRMAISRSREYIADESGAKLCKNPESLASALEKLGKGVKHIGLKPTPTTETTSHLFIVNPFKSTSGLIGLFQTHPPISERCKKLRAMKI